MLQLRVTVITVMTHKCYLELIRAYLRSLSICFLGNDV